MDLVIRSNRQKLAATWLDLPDSFAIITDRSIGREFSHTRAVQDRRARPGLSILPEFADFVLRLNVTLVIGQQEKRIVIQEVIDNWPEQLFVAAAKSATPGEIDHLPQPRTSFVLLTRPITARR